MIDEKKWEEEIKEIFVPHGDEHNINFGPFRNGYLAACRKRQKDCISKDCAIKTENERLRDGVENLFRML